MESEENNFIIPQSFEMIQIPQGKTFDQRQLSFDFTEKPPRDNWKSAMDHPFYQNLAKEDKVIKDIT